MGVDLTKNFYLSYTYSLASTLQHNFKSAASRSPFGAQDSALESSGGQGSSSGTPSQDPGSASVVDWNSMFVWNSFLTRTLREELGGDKWVLPLVHGYFEQRVCSGVNRGGILMRNLISLKSHGETDVPRLTMLSFTTFCRLDVLSSVPPHSSSQCLVGA